MSKKLSRREFLKRVAAGVAGVLLTPKEVLFTVEKEKPVEIVSGASAHIDDLPQGNYTHAFWWEQEDGGAWHAYAYVYRDEKLVRTERDGVLIVLEPSEDLISFHFKLVANEKDHSWKFVPIEFDEGYERKDFIYAQL